MIQNNDKDLLLISVFTTMTVALWVFFELALTSKTSTISLPVQKAILPLSSNIDTDTLELLQEKQTYDIVQ